MTLSMYSASAPIFVRMLHNARSWLDKAGAHAEAKKYDVNVLLHARLAPDMFALARQLQIATDHAKGCCARLAGVDVPKFEDDEVTVQQLQARLDKTIAFIESLDAKRFEGADAREIVFMGGRGERRFVGDAYLTEYAMPNFYFHITTAYALLRHNGVDLGKVDFLNGGAR